jgi:phosphotransferase system enzyme I (PtsI)
MERDAATAARELPSTTRDGVEMTIRANIEFPSEVELALRFGARGVGLYRSEFLFLTQSPQLPSEEEHYHTYRQIAEQVAPHPAIIRTLDLGGEKYFHEVLGNQESNPVLGLRAVRLCLQRLDIFRPQLRGLLRAATQENLQIMLPLVTTPDEILQVRRLLAEEAEQLRSEGVAVRGDVPLGIMVEVPAAAIAADVLAREADFFSLGTNDLIQYSLAVDRGNEAVSYLYQPLHPGVLRMVRFVADSARRQGIPVAMCGEMAADVAAIGLLIGLGLRELSVQPRSVAAVRRAVSGVDSREAEEWAERQLDLPSGVWRGQETAS